MKNEKPSTRRNPKIYPWVPGRATGCPAKSGASRDRTRPRRTPIAVAQSVLRSASRRAVLCARHPRQHHDRERDPSTRRRCPAQRQRLCIATETFLGRSAASAAQQRCNQVVLPAGDRTGPSMDVLGRYAQLPPAKTCVLHLEIPSRLSNYAQQSGFDACHIDARRQLMSTPTFPGSSPDLGRRGRSHRHRRAATPRRCRYPRVAPRSARPVAAAVTAAGCDLAQRSERAARHVTSTVTC